MKNLVIYIIIIIVLLISCTTEQQSDAYGNFEALETIISAESNGKLIRFNAEEGIEIKHSTIIGVIDTTSLYLQKKQIEASKAAISTKIKNILTQIAVYEEQLITLNKDRNRILNLLETNSATPKQLDDVEGQINVTHKQIASIESQNSGVLNEIKSLEWNIESINDQINKCKINNPISGTILEKYVRENEFVNMGKALYKIADLNELELRAYVSGAQLSSIKIGQKVKVLFDKNEDDNEQTEGIISWISSQSEFTPKIIQTKEERVKLVYAIKVKVKNKGKIKIGMPGEIIF